MTKHVSYRGLTIDMDSMRRENEKSIAIGNMPVNARGDQIRSGVVTKSADQIARENHRTQSAVVSTGLKGKVPSATGMTVDAPPKLAKSPVKPTKVKEIELPNGDIIERDTNES